jgi:hypothetical protein
MVDPDLDAALAQAEAGLADALAEIDDPELAESLAELAAELDDEEDTYDEDEDFGATYDPLVAPDPAAWLGLDEPIRIMLAERAHRGVDVGEADPRVHASFHVIVENQIALGDETPARAALDRLQRAGLDRHDAVHAIASVLVEHYSEFVRRGESGPKAVAAYFAALERLTAESWHRDCG